MDDNLDDLRRLLTVISPLPWWIEPAQSTVLHGFKHTLDAYIACGTRGDPSGTFDVIERYDVDTDYAYLVAAANAVPVLLSRITDLEQRADRAASALATAMARNQHLQHTLEQIANRDETEMARARTLHYDMRGWARAALVPEEQSDE